MGEVSKATVLKFMEELESGEAVTLEASHREDVSIWVGAITQYLEGEENAVLFTAVVKGVAIAKIGCFNVSKQNPTALAVWVAGWQAKAEVKRFSLQLFCAG